MRAVVAKAHMFRDQRYPRLLEMLDPADRDFLLASAIERTVAKHQLLYHQGDPSDNLFVIRSGTIKVHYVQHNGNSQTTSYYRDGMLVGAHGCTPWSGNHSWSAQALVDCRVLWLRRADYLQLIERSPQALRCALAISEFKGELLKRVIRILGESTLEQRIAMAVRHLATLYGIDRGGEWEIDGHFTHQEIAEMVGASRQSVTTLLVSLEASGHIRRVGRRLFVPAVEPDAVEVAPLECLPIRLEPAALLNA